MAESSGFEALGLDKRLLKAVMFKLCWNRPTPIQQKCIPLALEGKDVLARARTGSGKTAAYAVPIVHKILQKKQDDETARGVLALVLVPTKELCEQVRGVVEELAHYCGKLVSVASVAADQSMGVQKMRLAEGPDVLVATPGRLVAHLEAKASAAPRALRVGRRGKQNVALRAGLELVVFDEADLILSFGYEEDVRRIVRELPKSVQCLLMSATLSPGVQSLKKLVLHRPVLLELDEADEGAGPAEGRLTQHSIRVPDRDKYLLLYALVKLRLLPGKSIFFVNDVEKCYRLKIFFDQFGIKSAVLNSELPQNSRYHVLQEFNRGIFDYLIATDEAAEAPAGPPQPDEPPEGEPGPDAPEASDEEAEAEAEAEAEEAEEEEGEGGASGEEEEEGDGEEARAPKAKRRRKAAGGESGEEREEGEEQARGEHAGEEASGDEQSAPTTGGAQEKEKGKGRRGKRGDGEYGVSRGVDFRHVSTVINVDLPGTVEAYVHRVGRTARGGASGTAISLVGPKEEATLQAIVARQTGEGKTGEAVVQPFAFRMEQVEGFRYRVEDVLRGVTRAVVREARVRELRMEMLNSERLKAHFEEKPQDLAALQHTRPLHPSRVQPHLKHVPAYLLPEALRPSRLRPTNYAQVRHRPRLPPPCASMRRQVREGPSNRRRPRSGALSKEKRKRAEDPLSSFSYGGAGGGAEDKEAAKGEMHHRQWLKKKVDKRHDRLAGKLKRKRKEPGQF